MLTKLRTFLGFDRRIEERRTNSRDGTVFLSGSRHQRNKIKRLRDYLGSSEAAHHQLHHQLCVALDTPASIEEEFGALAADYFCMNSSHRCCTSDTNDIRELKREQVPDFCEAFLPHGRWYDEDKDHVLSS